MPRRIFLPGGEGGRREQRPPHLNNHGHWAPGHFPDHMPHRVHGMMPEQFPHGPMPVYGTQPQQPYVAQPVQQQPIIIQQPVKNVIQNIIPNTAPAQKALDPATPYKDLVKSSVYFTNEKWQECLSSHGIVIDADAKTLTMKNANPPTGMTYNLTDQEVKALTANTLKASSLQNRLDIINKVIGEDFQGKVTMDMLNSRNQVDISLRPDIANALKPKVEVVPEVKEDPRIAHVDGSMLNELDQRKGWYREGRHGRDVQVNDIRVEPCDVEGKYKMTAVINGETVSHEITQRQYDKFLAVDDLHRMKLFSDIFHEVDMKNMPHHGEGMNLGAAILAGMTTLGGIAQAFGRPAPDMYMEHQGHPRGAVFYKPGVDTPQDIASRAFEAGINASEHGVGLSR